MKKISETLAWLGTSYIPSIFSGVVAGAWLIALLVTGNTPGEIFTFSKPLPNLSSANIEVLTASPNPIVVCNASGLGDTTLTWVAEVGSQYEIRKSSPTGELTLATSSSGSRTVTSVPPNTTFFLNKATIVLKYVWRFSRTGGMYREKISQTIWDTVGRVTVLHTQQGCSSAKLSVGVSPATVTVGGSYTLTASSAGAGKQTVPYEGLLDYTERYCPFSSPLSCTTTSGKWGSYKLVSGKVSVNLPTTTAPGVYNFKFRPQGSAGEWSNEIALQVNPTIPVDLPTTNNIDINTIHSITYWDSLGNPSRDSSKWLGCSDTYTAELEAQVVKMRDVGFNAVWMIPWWKCFSNSDVYPNLKLLPEAMSRLRATLDMLKRNNMKAVLSLAYNGALADSARAKWVPSCDILRYRSAEGDPIGYWTIKDFYTQFLTDIQSYSNDVVILYHTEGYICNDRPWDTVSASEAQLVRDTVGRLPWDLPQELRRKFIIGYHDYLQNISENGAGTVTVTTATMPKSATGQIPYDFRSTGYYEPVSFTGGHYTLSDQEGFNQKLRNYYGQNMKTFYGEFGVGLCSYANNTALAASKLHDMLQYLVKDRHYGVNVWEWIGFECSQVPDSDFKLLDGDGNKLPTYNAVKEVYNPTAKATLTIANELLSLKAGNSLQLVAQYDEDGSGPSSPTPVRAAWTTTNNNVVSVDSTGLLQSVGPGEASISATYQGVTASKPVTVVDEASMLCNRAPQTFVDATATKSLANNPSRLAIDNNTSTFWNSGDNAPQSIKFDLGSSQDIGKICLRVAQYPEGVSTHEFYIPSPDGLGEIKIGTLQKSLSTTGWEILEVPAAYKNFRYLKISSVESPSWIAWAEVKAIALTTTSGQ